MLAIIIPTYNRKNLLERLLDSLYQQAEFSNSGIVIVVDGSQDGTIEMLKQKFCKLFIVYGDGNFWWTKSVNIGIQYATEKGFDEFLLMNDDSWVPEGFLERIICEYHKNKNCILGSTSVTIEEQPRIFFSGIRRVQWFSASLIRYHKFLENYDKKTIKGIHESLFLPGRGLYFSKCVVDKIGLFDDALFPQYYADFDFTYRAYKEGVRTLVSWSNPVFSYADQTAKGNQISITLLDFLKSLFSPMSPNNLRKTYAFYRRHAGPLFLFGFLMHLTKKFISLVLINKMKKS